MSLLSRILLLLLCFCASSVEAQEVDLIQVTGNRITKKFVILQQLTFKLGDEINPQDTTIQRVNEKRLKSLGIFNDVTVEFVPTDNKIQCFIKVIENWYIYPAPILELSDRNFSEWWNRRGRDLSRVNYGIYIKHINLLGMRDRVKFTVQQGFTKKYELNYNQPFLNKDGTWGYEAFVFFANQKELPYNTVQNRSVYAAYQNEVMLSRFRTGFAIFHRPNIYVSHAFRFEYHKNKINPYVNEELNPNYFMNNRSSLQFLYLNYYFSYDKRVFPFYPEGGYILFANAKKEGLGVFKEYDNLSIYLGGEVYKKLHTNWVVGTRLKVKFNVNRDVVAFANNSAIGYGEDVITGYELYVVDGTDFGISKSMIRYKFLDTKLNLGKFMPLRQFKIMNVELNARINLEAGYVNEPTYSNNNPLANDWLYSYGPSLDMILYNNYFFSGRLSWNHLGEFRYGIKYQASF